MKKGEKKGLVLVRVRVVLSTMDYLELCTFWFNQMIVVFLIHSAIVLFHFTSAHRFINFRNMNDFDLASDLATFIGYEPFPVLPVLPSYVETKIVQVRTIAGRQYVAKGRSPLLLSAASIVLQSDFEQLQL